MPFGLRAFLQSLTTGEAGFMNVCVGSTAFMFALFRHGAERQETLAGAAKQEFDREYDTVLDRINNTKPERLLDAMSWYRRTLVNEAAKVGIADPTRSELADEWLRRKRSPQDDLRLGTLNVPDAAVMNEHRLQLKRMWHSVRDLYTEYDYLQIAADTTDPIATNGPGYRFVRTEINDDLREGIARGTLLYLEPLDQAVCRATPECDWARDADPIYAFIRQHWAIDKTWPSNEQLFESDWIEPTSRVAVAMEKAYAQNNTPRQ